MTVPEPEMERAGYLFEYTEAQLRRELRLRKEARSVRPRWKWIIFAPFILIRWCWRAITPEGAKKFAHLCAGLLLCVAVITPIQQSIQLNRQDDVLSELRQAAIDRANSAIDTKKIIKSTDRTVKAIEEATSDEAKLEQAALYDRLITTIDCNSQINVQRLADELRKLNIPPEGSIILITEACARQRDEAAGG